jgi:hypothetical protein
MAHEHLISPQLLDFSIDRKIEDGGRGENLI